MVETESEGWARESYSVRTCRCGATVQRALGESARQQCPSCGRRIKR